MDPRCQSTMDRSGGLNPVQTHLDTWRNVVLTRGGLARPSPAHQAQIRPRPGPLGR